METATVADVFFFFSSRRRHTRLQGDWSSDVCSSDLISGVIASHPGGMRLGGTSTMPLSPPTAAASAARVGVAKRARTSARSEEHTSELQSPCNLVCRLLLEKKKKKETYITATTQDIE